MQSISAAMRRVAGVFCVVRRARLAVFVAAAVGLAGCQEKHEWHQKMTVVVDTPSGVVSGSSVIAINATYGQVPLSEKEVWYLVRGEATVVEVAPGRYLVALLGGSEERYYRAVRERSENRSRGDWLKLIPSMADVVSLRRKSYPQLITFRNIDDPKSVRRVDPNDLAASFGPGFSLDKITLEITDESVTEGRVQGLLAWWLEQAKGNYDPPAFRIPDNSPRGYATVGILEFIRGMN